MPTKKLLRFKLANMTVFQIDPKHLVGFQIGTDDEYPEHYYLYLVSTLGLHVLQEGSFDSCWAKLNNIHSKIDFDITDI